MENEEKQDLLLEISESEEESYEKDEIDHYVEEKILDYIQKEKHNTDSKQLSIIFVVNCLFIFIVSSVLIVILPIYMKYSSIANISTYSKMFTLSLANIILFTIVHFIKVLIKCGSRSVTVYNFYLSDVLKISFFYSMGCILNFWLTDGSYISCHLEDPLKGFAIIFSLLFYYIFSHKRMSLEKTFCAATVIVGVFVSVDFGICDRFSCNGNSNLNEVTSKFHFFNVILYLLGHGIWTLFFTLTEVCCTTFCGSGSVPNVSAVTDITRNGTSGSENKPSIQSLSIIYQDDGEQDTAFKKESLPKLKNNKKTFLNSKCQSSNKILNSRESENSLNNSVPCIDMLSVPDFNKFPVTSTPNNEMMRWQSEVSGSSYDIALWLHIVCWLIILGLCWLPTLYFLNHDKAKLLVDVIAEVFESIQCHTGWSSNSKCSSLPLITVVMSISYLLFILCSIELLKTIQSAVTVISIIMPALPVSSLFWSLFQLSKSSAGASILVFNPQISGEVICAVLGLPIIGIGIVLLMKSHIREFKLVV